MIFDPKFIDAIQSGRKTVTRRPANGKPCGTRVGDVQKVQPGQGQPALPGRIQIMKVSLEALMAITDADARREGYGGRNPTMKFVDSWEQRYGSRSPYQSVYRIEFEYIPAS